MRKHNVSTRRYIVCRRNRQGAVYQRLIRRGAVCLAAALCLGGCHARDLEDRDFPQAMELTLEENRLVGGFGAFMAEGSSFDGIRKKYQARSDKYLDLGHIKAIVLGEPLLADRERTRQILEELSALPVLARNILVFSYRYDDRESCLLKLEEKGIVPGEYLSDLYKNNPDRKQDPTATLGELMEAVFAS